MMTLVPANAKQSKRGGEPFASIGQGRISLSATACRLIHDIYDFSYAEVYHGKENGKTISIVLNPCKEKRPEQNNIYGFTRRKYKGEIVEGLNINSKELIKEFFGTTKDSVSTRYSVKKYDEGMLEIDITREM